MSKSSLILTFAGMIAIAEPLAAQGRGRGRGQSDRDIPPGHRPPPGMCRIWMDGVPPGQQPAPTTCEAAVRNQPPRSRIIWGENTDRDRRGRVDERDRRGNDRRDNDRRDNDRRDNDRRDTGSVTTPAERGDYPSQLPAMTGAVLIRVGVRTADVSNWIGSGDVRAETVDANGDGVPEQATWYDSQGRMVQIWRDEDRDGRADSVEVFQDGRSVRVIR